MLQQRMNHDLAALYGEPSMRTEGRKSVKDTMDRACCENAGQQLYQAGSKRPRGQHAKWAD